jgi:hypothetical protein
MRGLAKSINLVFFFYLRIGIEVNIMSYTTHYESLHFYYIDGL